MIVVSDTSPITNLAAVNQLTLLHQLYGTIKYLSKINYTYLTPPLPLARCLLPIFTRKLVLHDYLNSKQ